MSEGGPLLPAPSPLEALGPAGRPPETSPDHGRWCPFCGADLSGVPVDRRDPSDEAVFAIAGRRLKTAIAVAFVVVWLAVSLYDWLDDPATPLIPGWFSALGAFMLFYLLGVDLLGFLRRRH